MLHAPTPSASHRALPRVGVACAAALVVAGCSSLSPHIFSDRLTVRPGADGRYTVAGANAPPTLDEAYADAALLQARYATAVQDQGNATPQLSAFLIALSAATLYKGLTAPDSQDIAGAGVVGSASWALGSTLLSRPRLDVYRAGVEALGCAMAAVEPMRRAAPQLGQPGDAPEATTMHGRIARVEQRRSALQALMDGHAGLAASRISDATPQRPRQRTETVRPRCEIPAAASPARALALQAECDARPPVTRTVVQPAAPASRIELRPPAALSQAMRNAQAELAAADGQLASADRVVTSVGAAAGQLWRKSVAIQLAVSEQVDKTVPDLAAVRSVAQALKDTGFVQIGGTTTPGAPIDAQSDPKAWQPDTAELSAKANIEDATQALRAARAQLDRSLRAFAGIDDTAMLRQLNDCTAKTTGVRLTVTPAGDEITVAAGSTAVFFVSGGTGVPSAQVAAGPASVALTPKVEGGQFRFEFAVPATLKEGDLVILRFSDGAGAASHLVQLRVAGTPAGPVTTPQDARAAPANPASQPSPGAGRIVPDDVERFFGLPKTATSAEVDAALERCRSRLGLGGAAGSLDKPMADALRAGRCKGTTG